MIFFHIFPTGEEKFMSSTETLSSNDNAEALGGKPLHHGRDMDNSKEVLSYTGK